MQSDSIYLSNEKGISLIKDTIHKSFMQEIKLKSENINLKHHGWFLIQYRYIPKNYIITFESEFNVFDISITNDDGGYVSLRNLTNCDNRLTEEKVKASIKKLKIVLEQEISFYKSINDKLYKEVNGEYKRIKNWEEMQI